MARCPQTWDSNLRLQARAPLLCKDHAAAFWGGGVSHIACSLVPNLEAPRGPGASVGGGPQPLSTAPWRRFYRGKLKLSAPGPKVPPVPCSCGCQRACGCPVGRPPPPPWRAGQQPSSFHQLIIFTNLQPRKKVHSGLRCLGQEPRGEAGGTEARQRRSRPKATSCLSSRSCLGLQTQPCPLWPSG